MLISLNNTHYARPRATLAPTHFLLLTIFRTKENAGLAFSRSATYSSNAAPRTAFFALTKTGLIVLSKTFSAIGRKTAATGRAALIPALMDSTATTWNGAMATCAFFTKSAATRISGGFAPVPKCHPDLVVKEKCQSFVMFVTCISKQCTCAVCSYFVLLTVV